LLESILKCSLECLARGKQYFAFSMLPIIFKASLICILVRF
jgi:hypothetical protein